MDNRAGPVVYVASPFRGDMKGNVERTKEYSRFVLGRGAFPVNPILNLLGVLSEEDDREEAIRTDLQILRSGGISELWSFGKPTPGMVQEIEAARAAGIPVRYFGRDMEEAGDGKFT
ncbi:MAG: DUF4406 domain-containing protein [Lachnospiraceae bacterium]|nr:DUF4406 domain-containing protein [Lachnospiraceae bacterium]